MSRLLLLDSHAILHRVYHALPFLTAKGGKPAGAVFGYFSVFLKALTEFTPQFLVACFDRPEPTFRHQSFADYQAQRPKLPTELGEQIKLVKRVLTAADFVVLEKPGFEADDLLATAATKFSHQKPKGEAIIISGDRDLVQLVNKQTKLFLMTTGITKGKLLDEQTVWDLFGLTPKQIVDYKALVGDPSDNYKGVCGIGPKTAKKLLTQYGNLKRIYQNLAQLPPSLAQILQKGKKDALLGYRLARIIKNVPLTLDWQKAKITSQKLAKLKDNLARLGFKSLVARMEKQYPSLNSQPRLFN